MQHPSWKAAGVQQTEAERSLHVKASGMDTLNPRNRASYQFWARMNSQSGDAAYRLSDFIRCFDAIQHANASSRVSQWARRNPICMGIGNRQHVHRVWPDSVFDRYAQRSKCSHDAGTLALLVKESSGCGEPPRDACVVHLRLGDVLDSPSNLFSVDEMWSAPRSFFNGG